MSSCSFLRSRSFSWTASRSRSATAASPAAACCAKRMSAARSWSARVSFRSRRDWNFTMETRVSGGWGGVGLEGLDGGAERSDEGRAEGWSKVQSGAELDGQGGARRGRAERGRGRTGGGRALEALGELLLAGLGVALLPLRLRLCGAAGRG